MVISYIMTLNTSERSIMGNDIPKPAPAEFDRMHKVYGAIDFGTCNTGYAFSLTDDLSNIRTSTYGAMLEKDRVPTIVLLNKHKEFDSFGSEAQERYYNMNNKQKQECYYFHMFKMDLHQKEKLTKDSSIEDITQTKEIEAMKLFSMTMKYLKDLAVKMATQSALGIWEEDIFWHLTVPAIWGDEARQFMRDAAINGGIPNDRLRLVLEPEAASLFCRRQLAQMLGTTREETIGKKYILADLGGGTADICCHEIIAGGNLRELYKVTGGKYGGNRVNFEFDQFMIKLFGAPVWCKLKEEYVDIYLSMVKEFDERKVTFKSSTETITLKIEKRLIKLLKEMENETLEKIIPQTDFKKTVKFDASTSKMKIATSVMVQFYKPAVDGIVEKILEAIKATDPTHTEIEHLILVGGFAESLYLREHLKAKLPWLNHILEQDPRLAVVKGAVMMGYEERNIIERRARYSYGFAKLQKLNPSAPESSVIEKHCQKYSALFDKVITAGQVVKYGQKFTSTSSEIIKTDDAKMQPIVMGIYRDESKTPKYCETNEIAGHIIVEAPKNGWRKNNVLIRELIIGETQLEINVLNQATNEKFNATLDFLEIVDESKTD